MVLFLNDDFQNLDVGKVSHLMQSQSDQNMLLLMLLNILIHQLVHNVAEPILLTVRERQPNSELAFRHLANVGRRS